MSMLTHARSATGLLVGEGRERFLSADEAVGADEAVERATKRELTPERLRDSFTEAAKPLPSTFVQSIVRALCRQTCWE